MTFEGPSRRIRVEPLEAPEPRPGEAAPEGVPDPAPPPAHPAAEPAPGQ